MKKNDLYLRQCVIDVFCSTSTERSRNDSSLLLTWRKQRKMKDKTSTDDASRSSRLAVQAFTMLSEACVFKN